MAKRKKRKSVVGFSPEVRDPEENSGYETIFEKIVRKAKGEKKSLSWYKVNLQTIIDGTKVLLDEKSDASGEKNEQDENVLRLKPLQGHLYFYEYEAKSRWLPYYDKFPLVYVLGVNGADFYGANLHYLDPKKRVSVINDLKMGKINLPRNIIHKYLNSYVKSFFLDLAEPEWETSILLPVENFVKTSTYGKMPYKSEDVWTETNENIYDRIKAVRITKEYGN